MAQLEPDEWKVVAQYVYAICGIQLDHSKQYLIESRLGHLLEETGAAGYSDLYHKARADSSRHLERRIIDAITTGETSFFRDVSSFEMLRHKLLPELIDLRRQNGTAVVPIRIWSAACSTGQELYSIAITLRDLLGDIRKYDIRLVGTDISQEAVARASRAVYSAIEMERGMTAASLSRFFTREGGGWKLRDEIRGMASFRTINLLQDYPALGQFDIIFCRNVAIYFSEADKIALFGRMEKALASGGRLVIGATESLVGICPQLHPKPHLRSVFYERAAPRAATSLVPGTTRAPTRNSG